MKTKILAVVLVLAVLILAAGSAYSGWRPPGSRCKAHPWEGSPPGAKIIRDDHRVIMIPIFSDFLIWVYIKDIGKGSDQQKNSIKISERSYQIIFPW